MNKTTIALIGATTLAGAGAVVSLAQTPRDPVQSGCGTVTVTRATSADQPALLADAECFAIAVRRAADSLDARIKKAREVGAPARTPTPTPPVALPTVPPPGAFKADSSHYPINEACYPSCSDSIINRWRPAFIAIGFQIGHADAGQSVQQANGHVYEWWAANRCGGYVERRIALQPLPSSPDSGYASRGDVMHDPASEPVVQALYREAAALPPCN